MVKEATFKVAVVVLGLAVIVLLAGFLWIMVSFRFETEAYEARIESLQEQVNSLENRLAQLDEWLRGNITYYVSQVENLTLQLNVLQNQTFTVYERLEIRGAYAVKNSDGNFTVTLSVKNSGSLAAVIDEKAILYNGKPADYYWIMPKVTFRADGDANLDPGEEVTVDIMLVGAPWTSGMSVEIVLHTVSGGDYPKVVVLP